MFEYTKNPYELFAKWFSQASKADIKDHTAMTLATATKDAIPSARIVLLKHFDERGFCFYTNLTSRKAGELKQNQHAALCFYWDILDKQIRIEGKIEAVTAKEADDYFASRRRESRLGAWASKQSSPMQHENELKERLDKITKKYENQDVPRPDFWSGFRLVPNKIEFWHAGDFRLHDRIVYKSSDNQNWTSEILFP